jgi:nitrogen regulatory protein P-II 1
MKEIKIIVQDFKVSEVVDALEAVPGVKGLTAIDVRGFGRDRDRRGIEVIAPGSIHHVPRTLLLLVVPEEAVEDVLLVVQQHARTGHPGDGKVFVSDVADALRIRTGERGRNAL